MGDGGLAYGVDERTLWNDELLRLSWRCGFKGHRQECLCYL